MSQPPPLIGSSPWPSGVTNLVAAYRETDGEKYVVLYPPGRTDFAVA